MQPNKTYNYTQANIIFKYIFENHSIAILYIHKYFVDILRESNRKLLELVFPDGDYQYAAQYGEVACGQLVTGLADC